MASIPRAIPAVLGALAVLTTTALVAIHIILSHSLSTSAPTSAVRITAIISAALEATVLVGLIAMLCCYLSSRKRSRKFSGLGFGSGVLLCALAAAVSVAALVCLSSLSGELPNTILGSNTVPFLVGASVVLGLAFATQLVFLVVHFISARMHQDEEAHSIHTNDGGRRSPQQHVKSIPYEQTSPSASKTRGSTSMDSKSPPGSSGGRSATETLTSIRSSLSHVVRPISSKTRLLSNSQRSSRRPASLDSIPYRDSRTTEDGFDSWDTSAVDPHNRQAVMETSSPTPGRFLETIPASPTTSRSPSPGTPLDLEPPRNRRRSRSYSPAASRTRQQQQQQKAAFTQQPSASESHIHPLFRSDSPTPPPVASPGTVVIAAPEAGRVLSDRQSVRSLTRMRSGSLPVVSSPLSRQGSFDEFHQRVVKDDGSIKEELEEPAAESERKMTPPIPDWILSAGSRTSLSDYHSRKLKEKLDEETTGRS